MHGQTMSACRDHETRHVENGGIANFAVVSKKGFFVQVYAEFGLDHINSPPVGLAKSRSEWYH
jgi:hypothetical protein